MKNLNKLTITEVKNYLGIKDNADYNYKAKMLMNFRTLADLVAEHNAEIIIKENYYTQGLYETTKVLYEYEGLIAYTEKENERIMSEELNYLIIEISNMLLTNKDYGLDGIAEKFEDWLENGDTIDIVFDNNEEKAEKCKEYMNILSPYINELTLQIYKILEEERK